MQNNDKRGQCTLLSFSQVILSYILNCFNKKNSESNVLFCSLYIVAVTFGDLLMRSMIWIMTEK